MSVKDKNKTDYATFQKAIADEVLKVKAGQTPGKQFHEWISFAMDQGISLPYDFINLNRGYVILTKLLEETGSRYSMSLLAKRAGFRRPFKVAYLLFKAGDISLLDMLKMATRGFFQQKLSGPVDIEVKSVPESEPNIEVKSSPGSVVEEGTPSTENRKALSCQRSLMDRK